MRGSCGASGEIVEGTLRTLGTGGFVSINVV
jgi:hypothetical protein